MSATAIITAAPAVPAGPWMRHVLTVDGWAAMARSLAGEPLRMIGLWADTVQVHALFLDEARMTAHLASVPVEEGRFLALSPVRPAAAWAERMVHDLWGHRAEGAGEERSWLDHGHWPLTHPLSPRPGPAPAEADPPEFTADSGMQVPLGPVSGEIGPSVHLRLSMRDGRVGSAESRLGYAHKGTLALMRGKSPRTAARFLARIAADATVAHAIAFARAAESALLAEVPPRALWLRALLGEVERASAHLAALERLAEAASLPRLAMSMSLAYSTIPNMNIQTSTPIRPSAPCQPNGFLFSVMFDLLLLISKAAVETDRIRPV